MTIQQNIQHIQQRIRSLELKYERPPHSVALLAVTKKQSIENIQDAIYAGQTEFGENYLQEALEKIEVFTDQNITWHFIGAIQSNKTQKIAAHFDWVHTVCDTKIATRLNDQRPAHLPPLNICLQINVSDEKTKSGIRAEDALSLAQYCLTLPRVKLRGLMTIPMHHNTLAEQRAELRKLCALFDTLTQDGLKLDTLSMGMSDDLEAAIAEGATMVRIGTAIFGER